MFSSTIADFVLQDIIDALDEKSVPLQCPNSIPTSKTDTILGTVPEAVRHFYAFLVEEDRKYKIAASQASDSPLALTPEGVSVHLHRDRLKARVEIINLVFKQLMHKLLPEIENKGWAIREEWQIVRIGPGNYQRSYV